MNKKLKHHLIEKYRASIEKRYDYEQIKDDPNLPEGFTKKVITELRDFFLDNLYSAPAKREKLDAAFTQLETFIAHPSKVWGLLGNLPSAILQFGFHFPAAIKAAGNALETHTSARHFEDTLLQAAVDRGFEVPLTDKQFKECLGSLPEDQLQRFIGDLSNLFRTITDTELLGKTILIMEDVLKRMEEKKDVYGPDDKDAIMVGLDLFRKSHALLGKYDEAMKEQILDFVIYNETKFIDSLHKKEKTVIK